MKETKTVGIIGSGNSAWALSCYLASQGYSVNMYVRTPERAAAIPNPITAEDKITGDFRLSRITWDMEEFLNLSPTVFIATVTTAYRDVTEKMLPHLKKDHTVVLFSSKLGGVCEVSHILEQNGKGGIPVLETDAIFACRITERNTIHVKGFKPWNLYSCARRSDTEKYGDRIKAFFPFLEPADNFLQRGLSDFGAMCHPLVMLINMNAIDRKQKFLFYYEGFTEKTFCLLEFLEKERTAVAKAYETEVIDLRNMLDKYYCCMQDSLYKTLLSVPNYKSSISPDTLENRYIFEDVGNTLVPAHYLARTAGMETPLMDSLIALAAVVLKTDFLKEGRTLERLGFAHMDSRQILQRMNS